MKYFYESENGDQVSLEMDTKNENIHFYISNKIEGIVLSKECFYELREMIGKVISACEVIEFKKDKANDFKLRT